jgi:hypothetical protein
MSKEARGPRSAKAATRYFTHFSLMQNVVGRSGAFCPASISFPRHCFSGVAFSSGVKTPTAAIERFPGPKRLFKLRATVGRDRARLSDRPQPAAPSCQ